MTIFKRKSTPPTISPLAPPPPPPASTYHPQSQHQQHPQQYAQRPPSNAQHPQAGSYRGAPQHLHPQSPHQRPPPHHQMQMQPPNGHASPNDLARIGTNGTADGSVSSRSEKRRSGFFGLGGKKDKEKDRLEKEEKERERERQEQGQGVSVTLSASDAARAPSDTMRCGDCLAVLTDSSSETGRERHCPAGKPLRTCNKARACPPRPFLRISRRGPSRRSSRPQRCPTNPTCRTAFPARSRAIRPLWGSTQLPRAPPLH